MVADGSREDCLDFINPTGRGNKNRIRKFCQGAKLAVLPLPHHPKFPRTIGDLGLMEHDRNLRLARLFRLTHAIYEPRAIPVSAKTEGIILDFEPIETAPPGKQRGKLLYRLRFMGLEERMH